MITVTDILSLTKMQKRGNPQKWIRPDDNEVNEK